MESSCIYSKRSEPLSSLRLFYTKDSKETSLSGKGANSSFVWRASSPEGLPHEAVMQIMTSQLLERKVVAAMTGPDDGFQAARQWKDKSTTKTLVCGTHVFIDNWKEIPHARAFGKSISLYDTNPVTGRTSGDPIADAFVVKMRPNSAFLAVADGVNWGEAPMQAARCAINAVYEHLETNLFLGGPQALKVRNTRDAANLLFATFHQAHKDIVTQTKGLSTLCVGLQLPVYLGGGESETSRHSSALIIASVGDSQAFLLRDGLDAVEVTGWVPAQPSLGETKTDCETEVPPERDFRNAGGALGSVYESGEPELKNLMCAVVLCKPRDVIIFGTDGLTDNFDPVIVRIAIPRSPDIMYADENEVESDNGAFSGAPSCVQHKLAKRSPLSTPYALPVWPKPPPPSPSSLTPPTHNSFLPNPNEVSARSLNYTNQLELTWTERQLYALKELTRLWYELERTGNGEVSAADFGQVLLKHVKRVTAQKRQFLESPDSIELKAQFSQYRRKKCSIDKEASTTDSGRNVATTEDNELCELEQRRAWIMDSLRRMPGKLDHATVVILKVGSD